jgi:DNA-directed RNA polymerase subunit RPC12/RpoP
MNTYMRFKAAQAIQDAAQGGGGAEGGAAGAGMGLGLGAGFGAMMPGMIANAMQQAGQGGQAQPGAAAAGGAAASGGRRLLPGLRHQDSPGGQVLPRLRQAPGGHRLPRLRPAGARGRQVLSQLRQPSRGTERAESAAMAVTCTQCGAALEPRADERLVECPFCSTSLVVDGSATLFHEMMLPTVDAAGASAHLRRFLGGRDTVAGLDREARVEVPRLEYFPFWAFTVATGGAERVILEPAAPSSLQGLQGLELPSGPRAP